MDEDNPNETPPGEEPDPLERIPAVDETGYDPNAVPYDPAAALVTENQNYGEQEGILDPNAAPDAFYEEPGEYGYEDPNAVYEDPNAVYADPNAVYTDPAGTIYEQESSLSYEGGVYDDAPVESSPAVPILPIRKPGKKKPRSTPTRRPITGGRRPVPPRVNRPLPVYGDSGVSVLTIFLGIMALGMFALVAMVVLPKDMSTIGGYPVNPLTAVKPINILAEIQKVMIDRSAELSFSEEEVNQYLNHRLQGKQNGMIASLVKFRGVYVDFSPRFAEVVIEREIFGFPLTMSAKIKAENFRGQMIYDVTNWTFGRVNPGKRSIKPVIDLFLRVRGACMEEYMTMQQMAEVRFEENRVIFDPKI